MARRRRKPSKNEPFITLVLLTIIGFGTLPLWRTPHFDSNSLVIVLCIGLLLAGLLATILTVQSRKKLAALRALRMSQVQTMSGIDFEKYVGSILESRGYAVSYTQTSGDYGVDIVAKRDGKSSAIQIKRYNSTLGQDAVRQAVAGKAHYKCTLAMVITNSSFTTSAKVLAASNDCVLIDGEIFGSWMVDFQRRNNSQARN